ncbi:MAG: hypothetical protein J5I90_22550 [Caldilineales bacterium]|nr:hypothetical protein [Caldilineales bacterium]
MPSSLPALAAALAEPDFAWPCHSMAQAFLRQPLVPAYRTPIRSRLEVRVSRLADAVSLLAERLDRLPAAYRHWRHFDAGAFFDFRSAHVESLVRIEQLGATLDITLHADLLSPSFRLAERFWAHEFCPAYLAASGHSADAFTEHLRKRIFPAMQRRMQQARVEIAAAGDLLFGRGDITFLMSAAAVDERQRQIRQLPPGDEDLTFVFTQIPTLTLSRSFDLLELREM